jgi:hypothetical protein
MQCYTHPQDTKQKGNSLTYDVRYIIIFKNLIDQELLKLTPTISIFKILLRLKLLILN